MPTNEIFQKIIQGYGSKGETISSYDALAQLLFSVWTARSVYAVAELGIADVLKDGPKTIEEIAATTNTHAPSLYRLLRGVASVGIFAEREDGKFEQTTLSEHLRSDVPNSAHSPAIFLGSLGYRCWGEIVYSVKTGNPGFNNAYGTEVFNWFSDPANLYTAMHFNNTMVSLWTMVASDVANAYDFSQFKKIVDVGGSHGLLLESILRTYPEAKAVLFDLPHVIERTKVRFEQAGLADRCETISGSFFESVPAADGYIMSNVIHDWDDEKSIAILSNCRKAIAENGKVLLVEQVIEKGNAPGLGKFMDLEMLVITGGRERTADQYKQLLQAAGFEVTNIIATKRLASIIEAVPR